MKIIEVNIVEEAVVFIFSDAKCFQFLLDELAFPLILYMNFIELLFLLHQLRVLLLLSHDFLPLLLCLPRHVPQRVRHNHLYRHKDLVINPLHNLSRQLHFRELLRALDPYFPLVGVVEVARVESSQTLQYLRVKFLLVELPRSVLTHRYNF